MKAHLTGKLSILLIAALTACGGSTPASNAAPTLLPAAAIASTSPTALPSTTSGSMPTPAAAAAQTASTAAVSITWWGQAAFVIEGGGLKVLLDPANAGTGYKIPVQEGIDLITVSHEHSDHNSVSLASGSPLILRGLASNDWAKIDQTVKGVRVRTVGVYHDDQQGGGRGKDAIFIFDFSGLRVAHLGDLGHTLSPEQLKDIGPVDVILIPVGGYYTIDAKTAVQVIAQLNPRVVIPMHYKTADISASLATLLAPVDDFASLMSAQAVVSQTGQTITLQKEALPAKMTVIVMKYKP